MGLFGRKSRVDKKGVGFEDEFELDLGRMVKCKAASN